ncbi:hypothetical protein IAR55_000555 [Kwoniella newhampshirensis]|uniref:UV radiation resistance-associated gene protein n=1 Tax=Kwoniella newhampshirensis TaxID=1651941 RepID=A0AAW0Z7K3_9TREE
MNDFDGRGEGDKDLIGAEVSTDEFGPYDKPRIRHITGIRIHQLTLLESLPYASKFVSDHSYDGYSLDHGEGSSHLVTSPDTTRHRRRSSTPSFPFPSSSSSRRFPPTHDLARQRSTSSSNATIEPTSPSVTLSHSLPRTTRVTRPRAPTLAGEALENGHGHVSFSQRLHGSVDEQMELIEEGKKRLARCFVILKLVPSSFDQGEILKPKRANSDEVSRQKGKGGLPDLKRPVSSRTSSTASISSAPPTPNGIRPSLSASSSSSSIARTDSVPSPRTRTSSMTSPGRAATPSTSSNGPAKRPVGASSGPPLNRTTSRLSESAGPAAKRRESQLISKSRTTLTNGRPNPKGHPSATLPSPKEQESSARTINVPFFISPIHPPSTHPRFTSLKTGDFAPWLSVTEYASNTLELEVWVENHDKWKRLDGVGGVVKLDSLRRGHQSRPNGLEFTLSTDPKSTFYLPDNDEQLGSTQRVEGGVLERSMRETRMKKGVGVGGLHQLVNMHAVIADTERGILEVQKKLDKLLTEDVDRRALRREISQREERVRWINEKVSVVEKVTRETQARITLQQQDLEKRRDNLADAEAADDLLHGRARELEDKIESVETERTSLYPRIHSLRASHIQTLDALFPIQPLDPSQLLYTILGVPLPIPLGPKDPAPPLSLPAHRVDERTTAAALGYVAMVVQMLGNLGGAQSGGLPYIVTCAGSRSAVRDGVSVMQGPRSFPLYAKGVERYRYEYAVFLLNKNIEMLMLEANIRLLDLRHTLPNLKNLLLTLSSPVLPSSSNTVHSSMWRSGSGTPIFINSRASSAAWPKGSVGGSPASSVAGGSPTKRVGNTGIGLGMPSPLVKRGRGGRRSMLSRASVGRQDSLELEIGSEDESDLEKRDEESLEGDTRSILMR